MDDEDLASFLELDAAFSTEDFMNQLPQDLEMPMLQDEPLFGETLLGLPLDDHHSDSSDSGIEFSHRLKSEPMSPTSSHCSDFSLDSNKSTEISIPPSATVDLDFTHSQLLDELGFQFTESAVMRPDQISDSETLDAVRVIKQDIPNIVNIPSANFTQTTQSNFIQTPIQGGLSVIKIEDQNLLTPPLTPNTAVNIVKNGTVAGSTVPLSLPSFTGSTSNLVKVIMAPQSQSPAVTQVLNSKTKVLPKPSVTAIQNTGASKTLVLTPEEFAKLTSQKLLNIKTSSTIVKPVMTTSVSHPYKTQAMMKQQLQPVVSCDSDMRGTKTIKRQQRMMKNRESACLSRKRKKEYLTSLEERLQDFNSENEKLKSENENLRKTISVLQNENNKLKRVVPSAVVKGSTVLLGVLLLLSLNLGPIMSILPSATQNDFQGVQVAPESIHHGRTLMSYDFPTDTATDEYFGIKRLEREWNMLKQSLHLKRDDISDAGSSKEASRNTAVMLAKQIETLAGPATCPTYFNTTESQRLLKELRGWVQGHEEELQRQQEQDKRQQDSKHKEQKRKRRTTKDQHAKYPYANKLRGTVATSQMHNMDYPTDPQLDYGVQVFTGREQKYRNFLKMLQRRNDTFYVVSFRQDHMLLPATSHNKTMRPRMSVVMPATGLNETMTPPEGSIPMIQIDCEVTATKLVHIQKSAVPDNLDPNVTDHREPNIHQEPFYNDDSDDKPNKKRPWN